MMISPSAVQRRRRLRKRQFKTEFTRIRFCLKADIFFSGLPTVHMYPVKTVTENGSFQKTLSRVEIFENASFSFTRGRTKTEVFEYDDVMYF